MQFIDQRVEAKLADPGDMPAEVLEAVKMSYESRQRMVRTFEQSLTDLMDAQLNQNIRTAHIVTLKKEMIGHAGLPLGNALNAAMEAATRAEADLAKMRDQLIKRYAAEIKLEVKL